MAPGAVKKFLGKAVDIGIGWDKLSAASVRKGPEG
jgi:hypothetical protein